MNGENESEGEGVQVPTLFGDPVRAPGGPVVMPGVKFSAEASPAAAEDEAEREKAFDAFYEWNGVELLPFSIGRESLFAQLRTAVGAGDIMDALRDFDAFLADALRILFLCSHTPAQLRKLRRDAVLMQEAVEDWAEKNVKQSQRAEAINLASQIYGDAYKTEHEPAPAESGGGDGSGN